jgi:hypothetical protein
MTWTLKKREAVPVIVRNPWSAGEGVEWVVPCNPVIDAIQAIGVVIVVFWPVLFFLGLAIYAENCL